MAPTPPASPQAGALGAASGAVEGGGTLVLDACVDWVKASGQLI